MLGESFDFLQRCGFHEHERRMEFFFSRGRVPENAFCTNTALVLPTVGFPKKGTSGAAVASLIGSAMQ